ncbi:hypothetical protein TCAL_16192 [Tigriopus californicus]|uniref:Uncharacterized protein n=1 Tax=Tigriopus californicus TaxID=6832 RepID=A0A553P341_TIGCA|nr:hypothetical protein TCAL_16192 [Tigriopus californicus]
MVDRGGMMDRRWVVWGRGVVNGSSMVGRGMVNGSGMVSGSMVNRSVVGSWMVGGSADLMAGSVGSSGVLLLIVGLVDLIGLSGGLAHHMGMRATMGLVDGGVDSRSIAVLDSLMAGLISGGQSQDGEDSDESLNMKHNYGSWVVGSRFVSGGWVVGGSADLMAGSVGSGGVLLLVVGLVDLIGLSGGLAHHTGMGTTMGLVDGGVDSRGIAVLDGLMAGLISGCQCQSREDSDKSLKR